MCGQRVGFNIMKETLIEWIGSDGRTRTAHARLYDDRVETETVQVLPMPKQGGKIRRAAAAVAGYVEAERSLAISGPLEAAAVAIRLAACKGCEHLKPSYDPIGHCGECGCGSSRRAALTVKTTMPLATCPLGKWPKTNQSKD